ncbi:MAG: hypothetical protein ACT4PP_01070 [Sporichthyaceae bacterium]
MNLRLASLATTAALVLAAPGVAAAAPRAEAKSSAPTITFSVSELETTVRGSLTQPTGPLQLRILSIDADHLLTLFQLRKGYTLKEMRRDTEALFRLYSDGGKDNAAAFRRMERNVIALGGVTASESGVASATVELAPGKYFLSNNVGPTLGELFKLTITPKNNGAAAPKPDAVIKMTDKLKFVGPNKLPDVGTIRFENTVSSGHRWLAPSLLQVADGTTAKEVADMFAGRGPGDFVLAGYVGGDTLSPGKEQLLSYSVEPGTYALFCFFPTPDVPGSTYVAEGMVKIVQLD